MVFNNDCQYYSTLQNLVDMLSFSDLIKNSIHNNKKQHVNYQITKHVVFFTARRINSRKYPYQSPNYNHFPTIHM